MEMFTSVPFLSAVSALFGAGVVAGTQRQRIHELEKDVEYFKDVPNRLVSVESKLDLLLALHDPRAADKLKEVIENEPSD